jgi:ribonuclease HII
MLVPLAARGHVGPDACMRSLTIEHELRLAAKGVVPVAGVDEVGRGPLAGPVTAAAVVLDLSAVPDGIDDSKRLAAKRRRELAEAIRSRAEVSIAHASVAEIDEINIYHAAHLAMCRAVEGLPRRARHAIVDGKALPKNLRCAGEALVGGDGLCSSVAAASIVAKVARDALMAELAVDHPEFGWERNAGYATAEHCEALERLGPSPHHRRSFQRVHNMLCVESPITR